MQQQQQDHQSKAKNSKETKSLAKFKAKELTPEQQQSTKGGTGSTTETIIIDDVMDT